jgi:hypothetical protein
MRAQLVFLFSGHMIDSRDRETPRFPPALEDSADDAIRGALDALDASAEDVGITEGACGGDLLFAEAMLARGASLELYQPFDEDEFVANSVAFPKAPSPRPDRWQQRYLDVARDPRTRVFSMPRVLGPLPDNEDPYVRCNLWMLDEALRSGAQNARFLCLWDGGGGDGPGGTAHMRAEIDRRGGTERWIDIRALRAAR